LRSLDFESSASASSATPAVLVRTEEYELHAQAQTRKAERDLQWACLHNVKGGPYAGDHKEPPHNHTAYYYLTDEHPFGLVQSHILP
jgi:hypothetical protein